MAMITAYIPIYASAKFEIEKPKEWDQLSSEAKYAYFMANANRAGGLCHQCANHIESDFDIADENNEMEILEYEEIG